jgi:ABC-2 type transport system permease protein
VKNTGVKIDINHLNESMLRFYYEMRGELMAIFSDSGALLLIVFATMIYSVIYSVAYGSEVVGDIPIAIVDEDNTPMSRSLVNGVDHGPDTRISYETEGMSQAQELFYDGDVYGILYIPKGYERSIISGKQANVSLMMDGAHLLIYSHIMKQGVADILTTGAKVEMARLIRNGVDASAIPSLIEPVRYDAQVLYNPSLGYGSFVMPSVLMVIIQQTMIIGVALVAVRRRQYRMVDAVDNPIIAVLSKMVVYIMIYSFTLICILGIIWPIFDFPNAGNIADVALLLVTYLAAVASLSIALSHLFSHRESPLMLLLWSSVPVLLIAGVSYPYEAMPDWLYKIGRILPSSSGVSGFIKINSMGASLVDVATEVNTLIVLAAIYLLFAIMCEYRYAKVKL